MKVPLNDGLKCFSCIAFGVVDAMKLASSLFCSCLVVSCRDTLYDVLAFRREAMPTFAHAFNSLPV